MVRHKFSEGVDPPQHGQLAICVVVASGSKFAHGVRMRSDVDDAIAGVLLIIWVIRNSCDVHSAPASCRQQCIDAQVAVSVPITGFVEALDTCLRL